MLKKLKILIIITLIYISQGRIHCQLWYALKKKIKNNKFWLVGIGGGIFGGKSNFEKGKASQGRIHFYLWHALKKKEKTNKFWLTDISGGIFGGKSNLS